MRNANCNLVAKVDKIFLSKQDGDHKVGRGGACNICSDRSTLRFDDQNHERDQIGSEDEGEYLPVCSPKVV